MNQQFPYDTLDADKQQFRLVRLLDTPDKSIALTLTTYILDQAPEYQALSYVWGQEPADEAIKVNGNDFRIRPNLSLYLRQRIVTRDFDPIFIDAICINQNDIDERTSQVRLFSEIYKRASVVQAWLGEGQGSFGASLSEVQAYIDAREGPALRRLVEELRHERDWSTRRRLRKEYDSDKNLELPKLELLFRRMARKEYWSRLWIVPELLHARKAIFRYGSLYVSLDLLDVLCDHYYSRIVTRSQLHGERTAPQDVADTGMDDRIFALTCGSRVYAERSRALMTVWIISHAKKKFGPLATQGTFTIVDAICSFSDQKCQLPHDMIFAMAGATRSPIIVDYNISLLQLFAVALIDGMMVIDAAEAHQPTRTGLLPRRSIFYANLLRALKLCPWDNGVVAATRSVTKLFDTRVDYIIEFAMENRRNGEWMPRLIKKSKVLVRLISILATRGAHSRSSWTQHKDVPDVLKIYLEILETKYGGVTKYDDLVRQIPSFVTMSLADATLLARQIAEFPTRAEFTRLLESAYEVLQAYIASSAFTTLRVQRCRNRLHLLEPARSRRTGEPVPDATYFDEAEDAS